MVVKVLSWSALGLSVLGGGLLLASLFAQFLELAIGGGVAVGIAIVMTILAIVMGRID
ncbi:MAG: hypothetical protein ACKOCN_09590 [Planctomycetaceae bacterium]